MHATAARGWTSRSALGPTRSRDEQSSTNTASKDSATSAARRTDSHPGRNRSDSGTGDSFAVRARFPRLSSAFWSASEEPSASPSGSWCERIRNPSCRSMNAPNASNAAASPIRALLRWFLDLAQELFDSSARLERVVELEAKRRHDPELEPGGQERAEIRRGVFERGADASLLRGRETSAHPDAGGGQVPRDAGRGHDERAKA